MEIKLNHSAISNAKTELQSELDNMWTAMVYLKEEIDTLLSTWEGTSKEDFNRGFSRIYLELQSRMTELGQAKDNVGVTHDAFSRQDSSLKSKFSMEV